MQIDPDEQRVTLITSQADYEQLLARSREAPVVLFKHDPYCPISSLAYRQLQQVACDIAVVDVEGCRELSLAIAASTGVRHESPQVIVLREGGAAWAASTFRITSAGVQRALGDREGCQRISITDSTDRTDW